MRALVTVNLEEEEGVVSGFPRVAPLLERLGAQADLIYVAPPIPPLHLDVRNPEIGQLLDAAVERRDEASHRRLVGLLRELPAPLRGEAFVTRSRTVAPEITGRARAYDLVVVGTHARHGLTRAWLGSVAELVVRTCPVPVLVLAPSAPPNRGGGILVAVDLVQGDTEALIERAAGFATRMGCKVDLVFVVPELIAPQAEWLPFATPNPGELTVHADTIRARLADVAEPVPATLRGEMRVERGDPARVLVAIGKGYELLVLATHGRTGLEHTLLGSVAERVVRRSTVPVMVVPPAREDGRA